MARGWFYRGGEEQGCFDGVGEGVSLGFFFFWVFWLFWVGSGGGCGEGLKGGGGGREGVVGTG